MPPITPCCKSKGKGKKAAATASPAAAAAAAGPSRKRPRDDSVLPSSPYSNGPSWCASSFPAPLCLSEDDLSLDPEYPAQSFGEWANEPERNAVTQKRRTIYVVAPPNIDDEKIRAWTNHKMITSKASRGSAVQTTAVSSPPISEVISYLSAFYHGLPVKQLESLRFTAWDESSSSTPRFIGLASSTEVVRVRTRASPDGRFPRQLNLDDLLDAAISLLPDDAYALLLLTDHDLYESKDDLFCCGRAYGGSRVAVVSSARYNPDLDAEQEVERVHAWPASHCVSYVEGQQVEAQSAPAKKKKKANAPTSSASSSTAAAAAAAYLPSVLPSALDAAVSAYSALPDSSFSPTDLSSGLWLGRVCRTVAHELGHCFGLDHCVYFACAMQGSGSLREDARQPPYLCPIDAAKVCSAISCKSEDRDRALLAFCDRNPKVQLFAAFAAWIRNATPEIASTVDSSSATSSQATPKRTSAPAAAL